MNSPKNLKHKPIVSVNDYDKIDKPYIEESDAKALSIGKAQYDRNDISLKVWRHTGKKWSRQSEELPIHRNIDLNILLLGVLTTDATGGDPLISMSAEIDDDSKVQLIIDYYKSHEELLKPRLEELRDKLNEFLK